MGLDGVQVRRDIGHDRLLGRDDIGFFRRELGT